MAKDAGEAYLATLARMEPDIAPVDASAYYASAAISLKTLAKNSERIATALEKICNGGMATTIRGR